MQLMNMEIHHCITRASGITTSLLRSVWFTTSGRDRVFVCTVIGLFTTFINVNLHFLLDSIVLVFCIFQLTYIVLKHQHFRVVCSLLHNVGTYEQWSIG